MTRRLISSGSSFEALYGYSRAVVDGGWVFVAGTTGFDYAAGTISEDPAAQTRQAFRNVAAALAEAGAGIGDIVRATYFVVEPADWPTIGAVIGAWMSDVRPAATMLFCKLMDPRMKIEIEVTARLPESPSVLGASG